METSYWYCTDCKARLEHTEKGALAAAEKEREGAEIAYSSLSANYDVICDNLAAAEANACHGEDHCEALCEAREILSRVRRASQCPDGEPLFFYIRERFEEGAQGKITDLRAELKDAEGYSSQQAANIRDVVSKNHALRLRVVELNVRINALHAAQKLTGEVVPRERYDEVVATMAKQDEMIAKSTISRPNQAHREILDSTHRDVERIQHLITRIDRRIARAEARGE